MSGFRWFALNPLPEMSEDNTFQYWRTDLQ